MSTLLTLFFGSLVGITLMIFRKVMILQNKERMQLSGVDFPFAIPHLDDLKSDVLKEVRKYGYATLVLTLRAYVKSVNLLKEQYEDIARKIEVARRKNMSPSELMRHENKASQFLDMITDYKHKIKRIKHKIAEEEKSL